MKPIYIKPILLLLLVLFVFCANAQKFNATYTYDANGNRITATIIFLSTKEAETKAVKNITVNEELSISLNVYPNPTKGVVLLEVVNATSEQLNAEGNSIKVWDMQGKLIVTQSSISGSNTIDLSELANGIYLVNLNLAGKPNYIKVIKD